MNTEKTVEKIVHYNMDVEKKAENIVGNYGYEKSKRYHHLALCHHYFEKECFQLE